VASGQCVLVVDGLAETAQVLKAVLEPRGLRVERIRGHQDATEDCARPRPHLLVLHADDVSLARPRGGVWGDIPCVVIGSASVRDDESADHRAHYLQKPFCYRELIQAIEDLLA